MGWVAGQKQKHKTEQIHHRIHTGNKDLNGELNRFLTSQSASIGFRINHATKHIRAILTHALIHIGGNIILKILQCIGKANTAIRTN